MDRSAMDQLRHGTSFAVGTGSAVRTSHENQVMLRP